MSLDTQQLGKQIDGLRDSIQDAMDKTPYRKIYRQPWFRQLEKQVDGLKDSIHQAKVKVTDELDKAPYRQLFKFPWFYRWGVFLALFLLLSGLYYYFMYMPLDEELTAMTATRDDNANKVKREIARMKKLPTVENDLALLKEKLSFAQQEFPSEAEIPLILEKISETAIKDSLMVNSFKPAGESSTDYYSELYFSINLEGKYHDIMHFLNDTRRIPRLLKFADINLSVTGTPKVEPVINFTGKLVTYRYIKGSEDKPAEAKPGK